MVDLLKAASETMGQFGPTITFLSCLLILLVFFIWRDYRREDRQQKQIEAMQEVHNGTVLPLLTDCREAIASCREVITHNSTLITGWLNGSR